MLKPFLLSTHFAPQIFEENKIVMYRVNQSHYKLKLLMSREEVVETISFIILFLPQYSITIKLNIFITETPNTREISITTKNMASRIYSQMYPLQLYREWSDCIHSDYEAKKREVAGCNE